MSYSCCVRVCENAQLLVKLLDFAFDLRDSLSGCFILRLNMLRISSTIFPGILKNIP